MATMQGVSGERPRAIRGLDEQREGGLAHEDAGRGAGIGQSGDVEIARQLPVDIVARDEFAGGRATPRLVRGEGRARQPPPSLR